MLRSSGHFDERPSVRSATFAPREAAGGMMSEVVRCALTYDGVTSAPTSVIVKTATSDQFAQAMVDANAVAAYGP